MLLWIAFALIASVVVAALLRPVVRPAEGSEPAASGYRADIEVYKDQLTEIDRDQDVGAVSVDDAEAARTEVARRLLRSSSAGQDPAFSEPTARSRPRAARDLGPAGILAAAAIPLLSIGVYLGLGSPSLPGRPFAERTALPIKQASIAELIGKVEDRLREKPNDGVGWDTIGPVYMLQQRYVDAVQAFVRSIEINGESPQRLAGLAEASIRADNGLVSEIARQAYQKLQATEPDHLDAMFWLAVAKEQDGDLKGAADGFRALIAASPNDEPRRQAAEQRVQALAVKLNEPVPAAPGAGAPQPAKQTN